MEPMNAAGGIFGIIIIAFLIILAIEWIILPFAIFGTKGKLDKIIAGNEETNKLLNELIELSKTKEEKGKPKNSKPVDYIKLMVQYGIEKNGNKYTFMEEEFTELKDAVKFAKAKS